jgi:hypothetical protein
MAARVIMTTEPWAAKPVTIEYFPLVDVDEALRAVSRLGSNGIVTPRIKPIARG